MSLWTPGSWRSRPATQLPIYPDAGALARVEERLAAGSALIRIADAARLKMQLAEVAAGNAFLLQGGDCAESFAEFGPEKVRTVHALIARMADTIAAQTALPIIPVARIAGQFSKPRSDEQEVRGHITLPSYRGDAINGAAFDADSRTPDPARLLAAHRQAQATLDLLDTAPDSLPFLFTSHEGLLLPYEQALTRSDATGRQWASSAHMLWIGERTGDPDGAHVEFASGIANPIGLKCGPRMDAERLKALLTRLDPENQPGRLVLIGRFGAQSIESHLPALIQATRALGSNVIWAIDPMHGNTRLAAGNIKTRRLDDILAEIASFFAIARGEGVHPGGVHLEMTGGHVTECVGGSAGIAEADLSQLYLTHCDPRLNEAQAMDVARTVADLLAATPKAANVA